MKQLLSLLLGHYLEYFCRRQVFPKVGWEGLQTSPSLEMTIERLAVVFSSDGGNPKSFITTQQASNPPQNSVHPWQPQAWAMRVRVTIWSYLCLGFRAIKSSSPGSQARAMAGMRSVPMEMQRTRTLVSGQGSWKMMKAMKGNICPTCEVKAQQMDFLILSQIFLPSSIPTTIELKSSLRRIISAASFATSVPVIPIDIPISAFFMAGESFTPSPVTATTSPIFWHPLTMTNFWAGEVLANTICGFVSHFSNFFPCSDSGNPSSSRAISVSMSP